jgi:hypothetical protein
MEDKVRYCYHYFLYEAEPGQVQKKLKGPASWHLFLRVVMREGKR